MAVAIYEVQTAAVASGWYNCYLQKLTAAAWEPGAGDKFENAEESPIAVAIFNLLENYVGGDNAPMLAKGDKMMTWEYRDCSGQILLFGKPISPLLRLARLKEEVPVGDTVHCNLLNKTGAEITTGLGANILVHFKICSIIGNDAHEAIPRFMYDDEGDYMFVHNEHGTWYCKTILQGKIDCIC